MRQRMYIFFLLRSLEPKAAPGLSHPLCQWGFQPESQRRDTQALSDCRLLGILGALRASWR